MDSVSPAGGTAQQIVKAECGRAFFTKADEQHMYEARAGILSAQQTYVAFCPRYSPAIPNV
jgi:hypothetical protein